MSEDLTTYGVPKKDERLEWAHRTIVAAIALLAQKSAGATVPQQQRRIAEEEFQRCLGRYWEMHGQRPGSQPPLFAEEAQPHLAVVAGGPAKAQSGVGPAVRGDPFALPPETSTSPPPYPPARVGARTTANASRGVCARWDRGDRGWRLIAHAVYGPAAQHDARHSPPDSGRASGNTCGTQNRATPRRASQNAARTTDI